MPIDPTLYGGEPLRPESLVVPTQLDQVHKQGLTPARPVQAASAMEGSAPAVASAAARQQAERPTATWLESLGAGFVGSTTAAVLNSITDPHFEPVQDHSNYEYLQQIPFQLTKDESDYFQKAKSGPDALYRIERLKDLRGAAQASGDHVSAMLLAAVGDPIWVASGIASARVASGMARAATSAKLAQRAEFMEGMVGPKPKVTLAEAAGASHIQDLTVQPSRLVGAAVGLTAGTAIGLSAAEAKPMSTAEIITGMLLEGAAGAMVNKGKGLVKADQDFPADELTEVARKPHLRIKDDAVYVDTVVQPARTGVREIQPAEYIDEVVPGRAAVFDTVPHTLPKELSRATPNYGYRGSNFKLEFESDVERAAYIVAGSGKSARHQAYLDYLVQATGLDEAQVIALGQHVRSTVKQEAATASGESIKVPKLYKGDVRTSFVEKVPAVPASSKKVLKKAAVTEEYELTPAITERRKIKAAVYEEVPEALRPDVPVRDPDAVATTVVQRVQKESDTLAVRLGNKLQLNIHKTMASYGPVGKKLADLLFDNNSNLSIHSIESEQRAIKADLSRPQSHYENTLLATVAEHGYGTLKRIFSTRAAVATEQRITAEVTVEMDRRALLVRQGREITYEGVNPRIKEMADQLDVTYKRGADELKSAGVLGAETIEWTPGFYNRSWSAQKIEATKAKFISAGMSAEKAHQAVVKLVALSFRKLNNLDAQTSYDVAAATVNRALRKGMHEDASFHANFGDAAAKEIRDILTADGVTGARLERALSVMTGKTDEAGKAGFLKHRMAMDHKASVMVNGEMVRVTDLLDHNITNIVDKYIDGVSAQAAFARKGIKSQSDISKLRTELMADTEFNRRGDAAALFDESIKYMHGEPTGQPMNDFWRHTAKINRMISLGNSGLWQLAEFAVPMQKYGALKTIAYALAELPGFKSLMKSASTDPATSQHLKDVLVNVAENNLRLRPFIMRHTDGFEIPQNSALTLKLSQASQLVPFANGMKYIHSLQSRAVANCIVSVVKKAVQGGQEYIDQLAKYGMTKENLKVISADINQHGMQVDKWSHSTWAAVRPTFAKMMDESVLHNRMGDMPAFMLLDPVGKFVGTYRSFVFGAHNKILAGGLGRDGFAGVSLILMYQFPMTALAVQAQTALNRKKPLEGMELAAATVGVMGGLGLGSEVAGILGGKQIGATALIPLDRGSKLIGASTSALFGDGSWNNVAASAQAVTPFLNIVPPIKAMGKELTKE